MPGKLKCIAVVGVAGLVTAISLAGTHHALRQAERQSMTLECSLNLRRIGVAIESYHGLAGDYPGQDRPLAETLYEFAESQWFHCPAELGDGSRSYDSHYAVISSSTSPTAFQLRCPNHGDLNQRGTVTRAAGSVIGVLASLGLRSAEAEENERTADGGEGLDLGHVTIGEDRALELRTCPLSAEGETLLLPHCFYDGEVAKAESFRLSPATSILGMGGNAISLAEGEYQGTHCHELTVLYGKVRVANALSGAEEVLRAGESLLCQP